MGFVARVCQPSTLRMLICPEASRAQNIIAAVSAEGSTVWVLIRRLNSSCNRSIAFVTAIRFSVLMFGCGFQDRGVWCDHPGQRHREHEGVGEMSRSLLNYVGSTLGKRH